MTNDLSQQQYVNVLLPFSLEKSEAISIVTRSPERGRWTREDYRGMRAALLELESKDFDIEESNDEELVNDVVRALAGDEGVARAMRAVGEDPDPQQPSYITIDDLQTGMGPPEGVPIYNPYTNVLSVPTFSGVDGVEAAIANVRGGLRAEPAPVYRAIGLMQNFQAPELTDSDTAADAFFDVEGEEAALEALLEEGIAAETLPWGITRVNAPRAWARGFQGQGIRVAVVDTGIAPHVDLAASVAGRTFIPGTTSPNDDHGHGTHVAGTIAALRNGRGVIGVAPRAQLIAVKVLDRNGFSVGNSVADGIVWAANNGARIINLSLGGGFSDATRRALVYARSRRVAIFAAAGNRSTSSVCQPVIYPASDPLCIAVAATTKENTKAVFSCCGTQLDLCAPGVDILSTFPGNAYRSMNGTSMATPHAAGAAAVLLSKAPGLNPAALQKHLEKTATPFGPATQFGKGLVQTDRAVSTPAVNGGLPPQADRGLSEDGDEDRQLETVDGNGNGNGNHRSGRGAGGTGKAAKR